jgi:CRISPR-associated endonuclease/helicase Cas3
MMETTAEHSTFWDGMLARPGQSLSEHSAKVSALASLFGGKCGAAELSRIAGFFHDFGKISPDFQKYLSNDNAKRGSIKHSVFGAKRAYNETFSYPPVAEILSNAIAAHHGGLYDSIAPHGDTPLLDKLSDITDFPTSADCPFIDIKALENELATILMAASEYDKPFWISMLTKFIYSCLVDADRLDAYLSDSGQQYSPENPDWDKMLSQLARRLSKFDSRSEMGALRRRVSDDCAVAGLREPGIYKLEVPTGGGKTLSSLRFALEHARLYGLDRIIYIIPYLSILSQTAREIRLALGADDKTVLEHHSNFLPDTQENYKLHTNRWDAPVILTTQVQFLESIFSAKGSDLRKLHNMSRSVLIFDEAQSLPIKCVHLFNGAVSFLHRACGSTILLCSATQPLLDKVCRPLIFSENPSIADCGPVPERYHIENAMIPGGYSYTDLAAFILAKHTNSTLVIVNTKAAARSLYDELRKVGAPALHLSTNMCSAHRDKVIKKLRCRLKKKEPVICVSTQLIEAGVNISLECVVRDVAGLDSVFQAAGRCNRHGEFGEVKHVYVVNIKDENLSRLPDIKKGAEITKWLFDDGNLDIDLYYRYYFHERRTMMDYPINGDEGRTVYDLLSDNRHGCGAYRDRKDKRDVTPPSLHSAIHSASDAFYVIERGRTEVIVPYGESDKLMAKFLAADNIAVKRELLRKLGQYSVSLYQYQLDELLRRGALLDRGGIAELACWFYDKECGVDLEGS